MQVQNQKRPTKSRVGRYKTKTKTKTTTKTKTKTKSNSNSNTKTTTITNTDTGTTALVTSTIKCKIGLRAIVKRRLLRDVWAGAYGFGGAAARERAARARA